MLCIIINLNHITLQTWKLTHTRGHNYKQFKGCFRVNTHKYFFSNCAVKIWNALPSTVVVASSSNVFKRMLDCVDLAKIVSVVNF